MQSATVPPTLPMPMPTVEPACPPWCAEHVDGRADGGVLVHQAHLGARAACRSTSGRAKRGR